MDLEAANEISRGGFRDSLATHRKMLGELDLGERAFMEQQAHAMRNTLKANGVPITPDTAKALYMGVILPGVELTAHHPDIVGGDNCIEIHLLHVQLVATVFLLQQTGGKAWQSS